MIYEKPGTVIDASFENESRLLATWRPALLTHFTLQPSRSNDRLFN